MKKNSVAKVKFSVDFLDKFLEAGGSECPMAFCCFRNHL